jgi:hypothetical protein
MRLHDVIGLLPALGFRVGEELVEDLSGWAGGGEQRESVGQ